MTAIGERSRLISFERPTVTKDGYGQEIESAAPVIATAWAKILFGTGQERREAAQERAAIAATFITRWTPDLGDVRDTDRIRCDTGFGPETWDITSRAPVGLNRDIHFTAVRSASVAGQGESQ